MVYEKDGEGIGVGWRWYMRRMEGVEEKDRGDTLWI